MNHKILSQGTSQIQIVTLQIHLMTSFKLSVGTKMVGLQKVTSENLKIGKLLAVAASKFQELFATTFDLKSS